VFDLTSMRAHRDDLLSSVARWTEEIENAGNQPLTLWFGIAHSSIAKVSTMVSLAVDLLAPDEPRPDRPTLGQLVGMLERASSSQRATCTGRQGKLLRPAEIVVLHELNRLRASIAHMEERGRSLTPTQIGRLATTETTRFLEAATAFCRLGLIDELICREETEVAPSAG